MRNPIKAKLAAGKPVFGTLLTIPSAPLASSVAHAGLDWLCVDMEHGPIDIGATHAMTMATAGSPCAPIVRIPHDNLSILRPVLDCGAFGVIVPMVRKASDVERVRACLSYPPAGERGVGPIHACQRWGMSFAEYMAAADDELALFILIEDIVAVNDLEAILAVEGIDAAIIAPFDLSASMGLPSQLDHPVVLDAIARAEATILASAVPLGGLARDAGDLQTKLNRGYRVLTLGNDVSLIQSAIGAIMNGIEYPQSDGL